MLDKGYHATIASHASAFSFIHQFFDKPDPTSSFFVRKFLKGARTVASSADARLPITKVLLRRIIEAIPIVISNSTQQKLFRAIFLLAFAAFLRMGVICLVSAADVSKSVRDGF